MTGSDRERQDLDDAIKDVLATASGKRVIFWLLEEAGVYRDAFSGDDAATNYVLGQQSVGRKVISALDRLDPRNYPRLLLDVADLKAMDRAAMDRADQHQLKDDEHAD